jgi:DNA-binding CsgD family transcriptional regulator/sugar-specific transcriptional regulator TrmB
MLDILGLDDTAYGIYRLWLRRQEMTPEDVEEALGHSTTTVRRVRDRLVSLSLLVPSRDRPGHLLAIPPDGVLDQLLSQRHEQLLRGQQELARARAQVSELLAEYTRERLSNAGADVERLDGPDAVHAVRVALFASAEREVLILRPSPTTPPDDPVDLLSAEGRALRRGVVIRGVYAAAAGASPAFAAYTHVAARRGFDLRVADRPPADLMVVDGWRGLLLPAETPPDTAPLLLRAPTLTGLAVALFEQVWERATPVHPEHVPPPAPRELSDADAGYLPGEQERALLNLLGIGAKDEAAARQLGVSVRTVRRMTAELMRELDARSRFQAGMIAARRGWI